MIDDGLWPHYFAAKSWRTTALADFQAAMKAWRMACVAPTPAIEGTGM